MPKALKSCPKCKKIAQSGHTTRDLQMVQRNVNESFPRKISFFIQRMRSLVWEHRTNIFVKIKNITEVTLSFKWTNPGLFLYLFSSLCSRKNHNHFWIKTRVVEIKGIYADHCNPKSQTDIVSICNNRNRTLFKPNFLLPNQLKLGK